MTGSGDLVYAYESQSGPICIHLCPGGWSCSTNLYIEVFHGLVTLYPRYFRNALQGLAMDLREAGAGGTDQLKHVREGRALRNLAASQ